MQVSVKWQETWARWRFGWARRRAPTSSNCLFRSTALTRVLVCVLQVAIDGTDRGINAAVYGEAPAGEEQLIIGHEALGRVEAAFEGSVGLAVGDLVVPTV